MPQTFHLADDTATAALGQRLATALRPGDIVLLDGPLGAGKTALARSAIRALVADPSLEVPSPTFALVQPYQGGGFSVVHADLYRLRSERDIVELDLFDEPGTIVLIEWPGRVPGLLDVATVTVDIDLLPTGGEGRVARVEFADERPF